MKPAKIALTILFVLSLLIPSQSAKAHVAPPPAPQLGGLEPFGYQNTNVQMVYERVEMEIEPFLYFDYEYSRNMNRVHVNAYFTMHNLGQKAESMQVVFPLESLSKCRVGAGSGNSYTEYTISEASFEVIVDGSNVPIQKLITDHPYQTEGICDKMPWAGFEVTFPAGEDVVIQVQYVMEPMAVDFMQNIEYILETGAGWAGPIKRGYVIVKFPYAATTENVLAESTPGYQFLYNEVFWSFEDLEPTSEHNIQVSIVSPDTWQKILSLRRALREDPGVPEKWLELAYTYERISQWHGNILRSGDYFHKVRTAYEQGLAANPNNAELYAKYAEFQLLSISPLLIRQLTQDEAEGIVYLLNRALALEPDNETANLTLSYLESVAPFVTFTPPPTVPPTATPLVTATPSVTPTATLTPAPSAGPVLVTVVHTKLVKLPTSTRRPRPTATSWPTATAVPEEPRTETGSSAMIVGALFVFATGIGVGAYWSRRVRK